MQRTLIRDLQGAEGKTVSISGWVDVRRDHGKLIFLDVRDRSGSLQCVVTPKAAGALEVAKQVRPQWVVAIQGELKARPEAMKGAGAQGGIELAAQSIAILSRAQELPFELGADLNIDTHLDHLPLTLRSQRSRDIFSLQATVVEAYRASLRAQDFTEYQSPILAGSDAEGGAAAFGVEYHYDQKAFLATSPQLYKQIMVGPFERVFTVTKIFRGEKHATTRHLAEATCIDFEMAFIESERDPMRVLGQTIRDVIRAVSDRHADLFDRFKTSVPLIPDEIPILTLAESFRTIGKSEAPDLEPEDERSIAAWAKKEKKSDFVFITRFPTKKRAFYTYEDPSEAPYSRGFDLLFRGLEINSGSQRIHEYEKLLARMKERDLEPEKFEFYLQAFKWGMPPHGGSSTGLERFTARMLELQNVKEATLFPRDLNRIDLRLSQ